MLAMNAEKNTESKIFRKDAPKELWKWSREAYHYEPFQEGVRCTLCPNNCYLKDNDRGRCRVRVNKSDKLYSLVYGNPSAVHIDPVEKKPFFHFLPGTTAFSVGTAGCNLRCLNCQNWTLSQSKPEEIDFVELMPEDVVRLAQKENCSSVAYTYAEPTIFYEYAFDTAKLARKKGLKNLWVSNGYINEKPLRQLCRYIDAANIDLKSFSNEIYLKLNSAGIKPILNTLKVLKEEKVWLEITNLVIPEWNDDAGMIREMSEWLYSNGFADSPLHFSRFTPLYRLKNVPATPFAALEKARRIALDAGLKYVYIGNVPGSDAENTFCPKCGKIVIERAGYSVSSKNLVRGSCKFCREKISGVWN